MSEHNDTVIEVDDGDEPISNFSGNPHFSDILARSLSRRSVVKGGLGAAVAGTVGATVGLPLLAEAAPALPNNVAPNLATLGFDAVPPTRSDTATVPHGHKVQVLIPWGTPITGDYPEYKPDGTNTGAEQEQQVGSHHDGMHFFTFGNNRVNRRGLLCVNHEYVDQRVMHPAGPTLIDGQRPADEVRKEIAAHGASVVEIELNQASGEWDVVRGGFNRRVTANTPMEIKGPLRGTDFVKTKYSPDGTMTRGTINNCAHGYTPWGTYLTCEENWAGYFVNRGERPREQSRYGVSTSAGRYRWEAADSGEDQYLRFDATPSGESAAEDYRNEPNGQGWVVEIDPFAPASTPVKRTRFGRFAHEGAWLVPPREGEPLVWYMGDDAQNEYMYKFVSSARYSATAVEEARTKWWNTRLRRRLSDLYLDHGILYVAKFHDDGSGEWLPLTIRNARFRRAAAAAGVEFATEADVLVNTRLAADVIGATPMDRPEWGTVDPRTRVGYMAMTNNASRTADAIDAANPRGPNPYGHIIRWREGKDDPAAKWFRWDIFVLSGTEEDSQVLPGRDGPALTQDNIHASADGLWMDQFGTLWIQTDMSGAQQGEGPFGENQMLAANPRTGEIKRFLVGPFDQETTGVVSTRDGKNLFVNFQHPGDRSQPGQFTSNWPDSGDVFRHGGDAPVVADPNGPRPRSATVVITREDGGIVGR